MPIDAKPLFRPDVLRPHLSGFRLPDRAADHAPKLAHWAELLSSQRADSFARGTLHPATIRLDVGGAMIGR